MIQEETKERKYYTCKYDRPFKEIFLKEKNKDMLKDLLELILKVKIKKIELRSPERNTGNINIKRKTYDALLDTDIGKIEIEVNANKEEYVHPRNTAYICDLYSHSTLVSESYDEEIKYIQINLSYALNKEIKPISVYKLRKEEGKEFVKNLEIVEVNMDYFVNLWYDRKNKSLIEKNKLLIMLGLEKEELKELSNEYNEVNRFMEELDKVNENPKFREYMTYEEDQRKIYNSRMKCAEKEGYNNGLSKGMKEGLEKGIEQGIAESKSEIARKLINNNIDINIILESTGLSIEELEKIKRS